ncbi:hypothetical protein D9756_004840 [Leucocoprinus leucothites]|uniref:Homeobox domain-containing protein n=1 Tax=Leucocoprinus leucothites TaxID=201217 RepID=A0A8H5G956_9AGAR|nr:hypothetical protein D9756_004840 [Leucoagaricus leucothites]
MPAELINPTRELNTYNVAQLQYALESKGENDTITFLHDLSPSASPAVLVEPELDYESRRMSSSATSTADTDSSGLSRSEKRAITPADSPQPQKSRGDQNSWENDSSHSATGAQDKPHSDAGIDQSKVQLPSIFTSFEDNYPRRASLPTLNEQRRHQPYPSPNIRGGPYTPSTHSNLSNYTFPPPSANDDPDRHRPRLSTDLNNNNFSDFSSYPPSGLSNGTTPSTSFSSSTFTSPMTSDYRPGLSPYNENDNWNVSAQISRPSSTPGHLSPPAVKYDDSMRHASFSAMPQAPMFAGSARISGQHDRRPLSGIKGDWSFPNNDFGIPSGNPSYSASMPPAPPSIAVAPSPSRSPQTVPSSTLVDRPQQRKRGKLPKETTDFLKAWLHRHSDHPYPSEEEKKQLCHATGLSMSQVSNWMINARRRILAPAHRAASGPTTTAPFPPASRSSSLSGILDNAGRRASMPNAESLQLYHPMTLQSMPNTPAGHHHHGSSDYMPSRHMMGPTRSPHHLGPLGGGVEYGSRSMGLYVPGQGGPHSAGPTGPSHYLSSSSDVPLSAPPSMSNNPFSSNSQQTSQQNLYPPLNPSPRLPHSSQTPTQYFEGQTGAPGSAPGSGYATPQ